MATNLAEVSLLATKLFVPRPRRERVSRDRLRDELDAARGGIVVLAAAPAGSGKSTLLADWALTAPKRVAWLSLDSSDDEPCRFLNYVIAALKNAAALRGDDLLASVSAPSAVDAVLTEVLNGVAADGDEIALILDDYHVIESRSVHDVVQKLIDHLPPNLQLVIASRIDPPLSLSRLRARGTLLELRAADLRFTRDEAARFLNEAMDLRLTDDQVDELERRTEGWAVGLQMAAISLRGREGATSFISGFSGTNRYVLDYLTDEVLHRQPEEVRSFLLETSILSELSAPLCNAVGGRDDADQILRLLDAANLFLIPLDDVRHWYRYHHLFGSLLQHELTRSASAERLAALHQRAAGWYAENRMPEKALSHAVAAGDTDRAVDIVMKNAPSYIVTGDGSTIVRWIAQLPAERVENDLDLLILHVRALTTEYEVGKGMRAIERAEQLLNGDNRALYEGPLLSLRGMLERLAGEGERSTANLERALSLMDPEGFWYSMTSLHLGIGFLFAADLRKAEEYCSLATRYRGEPDGLLTAVLGQCYAAMASTWRGAPDRSLEKVREANVWVDDWSRRHGFEGPLGALTHDLIADVNLMRNDLPVARSHALRAIELSKGRLLIAYCEAVRVLCHIAIAEGEWDSAIAAAKETFRGIRCSGNDHWATSASMLEYCVLWRRGQSTGSREDLEKVARWCEATGLLEVERWREHLLPGLLPDVSLLMAASVLVHQQRFEEAERLSGELYKEALRCERVPGEISALVLRALAEAGNGRSDAAVETMREAIDIASKPGYIRYLLDEGSVALPLIERAAPHVADRDFALRLLSTFNVPVKLRPAPASLSEALSDREIEVLRLIAAGATNEAAARKLFVAPSTVKKHLENIYAKLGVGGRTHAVARARELQLL